MIAILAHRFNLDGPDPALENRLESCNKALRLGFGVETDLRRDPSGLFYISHDRAAWSAENDFGRFSRLFRASPACVVAMNVKELGYETDLARLAAGGELGDSAFYFDFELLETTAPGRSQRFIHSLQTLPAPRLAARLSDRNEPLDQCLSIPAEFVWADEFDSLWLTEKEVRAAHQAGRKFYVISPEIHGFDEQDRLQRWAEFKQWRIDGLCTDYPLSAREFFLR